MDVLKRLKEHIIIPVIRTETKDQAEEICSILIEAGFTVLEITRTVPDSQILIKELQEKNPGLLIGAGTVLNKEEALQSIENGACFIVSPVLDEDIIKTCQEKGILSIPGVLTPTEVHKALSYGIKTIKIFPAAHVDGSRYIKAIKTIFPDIDIMPSSGINKDNMIDYLDMGSALIGMGGNLVSLPLLKQGKKDEIKTYAQEVLKKVNQWKQK